MSAIAGLADAPRRLGQMPLLAAGAVVLIGALAVVEPAAALGIPVALAFVWAAFRSLAAGVVLFTLVIPLEYVPGLEADLGFIKLAGGVLVVAWAGRLLRHGRDVPLLLRARPWLAALLIGLVLWALASSLWAADSAVALSSALRLSQGVVLVFVVYSALRTALHLRWLLGAYVVGALIAVGFGLLSGGEPGRLAGAVGDPNELAAFLLPAVMLCAFATLASQHPVASWAYFTTGLFLLVALFMTGSRGGLVALAAALLAAVAVSGRERVKTVSAVLVVAGCGVAYFTTFAPPDQVDRLAALRDDGGTGRSDIWAVALETVRDRPVLGVGAGNFPVVEGQYATREVDIGRIDLVLDDSKVVHNTYLSFLSELGIVGFAAFALLALAALRSGAHALARLRSEQWELELVIRGFLVGLLGMLVAFTFFSAQYEKQLWLLLGVAFALPSCLRRGDVAGTPGPPVFDARADYHRPVSLSDPERPHGWKPEETDGTARRRLARQEGALRERERLVAERERELRSGMEADGPAALPALREELEETRNRLDESLARREADLDRLGEAAALLLEAEERIRRQHDEHELEKRKLRAQVRALRARLKESEERARELDRPERDSAQEPAGDEPA